MYLYNKQNTIKTTNQLASMLLSIALVSLNSRLLQRMCILLILQFYTVLLFTLQMQVAGMPAYTDLTRAHEIANQARRLHKDLRDSLNDAAKYNNRERLFDMPVTNVSYQLWCMLQEILLAFRVVCFL
jgi:hypothetical protein